LESAEDKNWENGIMESAKEWNIGIMQGNISLDILCFYLYYGDTNGA
jgi:hypothetical protein